LANRLVLFVIIFLLASPIALLSTELGYAQNSYPIFGYPYHTYGGGFAGYDYSYYGTSFTLNGDATITSISCEMAFRYSPSEPDAGHLGTARANLMQ